VGTTLLPFSPFSTTFSHFSALFPLSSPRAQGYVRAIKKGPEGANKFIASAHGAPLTPTGRCGDPSGSQGDRSSEALCSLYPYAQAMKSLSPSRKAR